MSGIASFFLQAPGCPWKCFKMPAKTSREAADEEGIQSVFMPYGFVYSG
jgi:hypothetical protein